MIVLDTHALIWWLAESSELSATARRSIEREKRLAAIAVSAISIFEIATLLRRRRLSLSVTLEQFIGAARALPELRIEPVTDEVAKLAGSFAEPMPGDPADRLISATAMALQAKLITADRRLHAIPGLTAVW